jgi:hypothetical protein
VPLKVQWGHEDSSNAQTSKPLSLIAIYLAGYPDYCTRNLSREVRDICIKLGISNIDIYEKFIQNNPSELYFKGDNVHWNARGQGIAAEALSKKMRSYGTATPSRVYN